MNISSLTRKKPVENFFIFLFFVYLGFLQYSDHPTMVGSGFLFLWLMSFLTTNRVFCIIGSFMMTNIAKTTLILTERFQDPDETNNDCKQTCFAMTTDYEQKIMVMEENEDTLNSKITVLKTDIELGAAKYASLKSTADDLAKEKTTLLDIVNRTHAMSK